MRDFPRITFSRAEPKVGPLRPMTACPPRRATLIAAILALPLVCPAAAGAFRISDPLAAAPSELRVTLGLPPGFGLLPGSAVLNVSVTNPKTGEKAASSDPLAAKAAGEGTLLLTLSDPSGSRFSGLEATVAAWRAARAAPVARIGVDFTPCRTDPAADPPADPKGPMTLALQPAPGAPRLDLLPLGTTLADFLSGSTGPIAACPN